MPRTTAKFFVIVKVIVTVFVFVFVFVFVIVIVKVIVTVFVFVIVIVKVTVNVGVIARAYKKFFPEKKCHFATSPVFIGVRAVALWWH